MIFSEDLFVDTSAWVALADTDDVNHHKAAAGYPAHLTTYRKLVTTNLVITETFILLRKELGHGAAVEFLKRVRTSPRIERIYSTETLEREAEDILKKYVDQDFSYTDAVSFVIMKRHKVKKAFAFDKHFSSAGFILLS